MLVVVVTPPVDAVVVSECTIIQGDLLLQLKSKLLQRWNIMVDKIMRNASNMWYLFLLLMMSGQQGMTHSRHHVDILSKLAFLVLFNVHCSLSGCSLSGCSMFNVHCSLSNSFTTYVASYFSLIAYLQLQQEARLFQLPAFFAPPSINNTLFY